MTAPNGGAFAHLLSEKRARFNSQFAEAKRAHPALDAEAFGQLLTQLVGPIVEAVAAAQPHRAEAVAVALYELSLNLLARDFLGPNSRYPALANGWRVLFTQLPNRLAEAPVHFPGAITNALYNLSATPGARADDWVQAVLALSPACGSVPELLTAAQVIAWRAGLAHYRLSALARCHNLPPNVAGLALGLPVPAAQELTEATRDALLDRLVADPWLDPAASKTGKPRLQIVARAGAFRGFGGLFLAPPSVACPGGQFVVSDPASGDGTDYWLLFADRFGATFQRVSAAPHTPDRMAKPFFQLNLEGELVKGELHAAFPELARSQSSAANETTLAVTTPLSHAVTLIAVVNA